MPELVNNFLEEASKVFAGSTSTPMLTITQTGTGHSLLVEDSSTPDSTPFVVTASGGVGVGTVSPSALVHVNNSSSADKILLLKGASAQSGNFFEIQDSSSNVLFSITSSGQLANASWTGSIIAGQYGGTGVNNSGKTITLGGNLTTSGAFNTTLTVTGETSLTLPTSGTLVTTATNLGSFASTTSSQLAGVISDETGSGSLVFATSPSLTTPNIGAATGTSFTATGGTVLVRAAATQDGIQIQGGSVGTSSYEITLTPATLSADRTLTLPNESGTVATTASKLSAFASTTSAELAGVISDETGTGVLVFGTSPTITTSLTTGSTSFDLINTTATTVNFAGAATTISIANTATAAQTLNIGTASTGASTYNFGTGGTTTGLTKTLNIGTGGASGSTTNINIGSTSGGTISVNNALSVTGSITGTSLIGDGAGITNITNADAIIAIQVFS